MAARRRTTWVTSGLMGLATTAGLVFSGGCGGSAKPGDAAVTPANSTAGATQTDTSLPAMAEKLRQSDIATLSALAKILEPSTAPAPHALSEAEAAEWLLVVKGLRGGYLNFTPQGRALAVDAAEHVLRKFAIEPAPPAWIETLTPFRDIVCTGLADRDVDVRASALASVGRIWGWYPGRSMLPVEEEQLGEWKNAFQTQVALRLADPMPKCRAAAIACLGLVPIDRLAEPAIKYVDDPSSGYVRNQVLVSFANRPSLLTEEMILKRLHDTEPGLPQVAEIVLKTRGLTQDQIVLGKLITSPKPELRASVIPLLKEHPDLDPVVWLLKLSQDTDELVRTKSVEAMTGRNVPEVLARLREMAAKDSSATVRAAAGKLVATLATAGSTAALPPLPGSPSLTPKAN